MVRLLTCSLALALLSGPALAGRKPPPPPATMPKLGDSLPPAGGVDWPAKLRWLYDVPSPKDAAGKVIINWFCAPKVAECVDDLARLVTLREAGKVYIVAYIAGSAYQAKKLDPIRESEGIGHGTVAYGRPVMKLAKDLHVAAPASIVVGVDGKVALISMGGDATTLDARDAKVQSLVAGIHDYSTRVQGPTATVKAGDPFTLAFTIDLASWLTFDAKTPAEFSLMVPKDIHCGATTLRGDQLKVAGQAMTASVTCTAPKGSYEARGQIRFSYRSPTATSLGNDGTTWKFKVE